MKLYDSLSSEVKEIDVPKYCIYTCGPTVYSYIHIGNARPLILTDIIIRYLDYKNIKHKYLLNITDIDDKIINQAEVEGIPEEDYAKKYTESFLEDMKNLNVKKPEKIISISEKINEIVDFIDMLIKSGHAYEVDGDVYFNVKSLEQKYGNLSKQSIEELEVGNRIEENKNKINPQDFVLWKKTTKGKKWLSKWSLGRPGWHTECVALIDGFFSNTIDIHVGGIDLKFPHHENERIQYIAKKSCELSNVWLHNGHLSIDNIKMSKSLKNTILVKDFIRDYGANELRYIFLNSNYKQPININQETLKQSSEWVSKIENLLRKMNWSIACDYIKTNNKTPIDDDFNSYNYVSRFRSYINNDLNTPMIISLINEMVKNINKQLAFKEVDKTYEKLVLIINTLGFRFDIKNLNSENVKKIREWQGALLKKDFEVADKLRKELKHEKII